MSGLISREKVGTEDDPLAVAVEQLAEYRRPRRVFFLEDDDGMRKLFGRRAEDFNCEVDYGADGRSSLAMILRGNYDLVILDVRMPGEMDGVDVFREMRAAIGDNPPVTIFTGMLTDDLVARIEKIGFAAFIKKPNDFNDRFLTSFFAAFGIRKKQQP